MSLICKKKKDEQEARNAMLVVTQQLSFLKQKVESLAEQ